MKLLRADPTHLKYAAVISSPDPSGAAAYPGHALFHAATRSEVGFEEVIREYGKIGHRALGPRTTRT